VTALFCRNFKLELLAESKKLKAEGLGVRTSKFVRLNDFSPIWGFSLQQTADRLLLVKLKTRNFKLELLAESKKLKAESSRVRTSKCA
jgi:hypothetical protein